MNDDVILVAGAGGFIGAHLVADLLRRGHTNVRAVDIKAHDDWFQLFDGVQNIQADLSEISECRSACENVRYA